MLTMFFHGCILYFVTILSGALCSVESAHCDTNQARIVGLFNPLSYQDRAVQLAFDNRSSQVCYEPFRPFSANASEVWQDVCGLLSGGLLALITDQPLPVAVRDVIDAVQISVVSTSIITTDTDSTIVSIAPSEEQLANALSALIVYNSWTDVVLLTWQGSGLELFMPDPSINYKVAAVYHIDTSDTVMRSRLIKGAAHLHDAFNILLDGIDNVSLTIPNFTQIQHSCEKLQQWQYGRAFQVILKEGSSDQRLTAGNISYHYFSIDQDGINKIATLTNEGNGIHPVSSIRWCTQEFAQLRLCQEAYKLRCTKKILPPRAPESSPYQFDYSQYTFDVVTIQSIYGPFVMIGDSNDDYQGLCIDLMDKLGEMMGFSYRLRLVEDGNYGGQDEDGNWLGLVGDLVNQKAEIALAPLTITSSRETVIDFTKSYYDIGLQAMYIVRASGDQFDTSELFTFLKPFDTSLWLLALASLIVVSVGVAATGRLSPYDWYQSPPDHLPLWEARFQMTLFNSVWQSLTAILQQGAETAPQSTSGRILMGGWWFVCIILAAVYTANLTAIFATEDDSPYLPGSIDELISKIPPNIPFGVFNNTQPAEYLQHSPIQQYRDAFEYMKMEGFIYENRSKAITALLEGSIAIIADSPIIDYLVSRKNVYNPNCTLTSIGDGQFSSGGYGLGLTKNSPFTDDFSLAILELRENGEIEKLRNEYFNYQRTCTSVTAIATSASINMNNEQINLEEFGGLFIILGIAVVISFIILLAEHTFKHRNSIKAMLGEKFYTHHKEEETAALPDSQEELRTSSEL